MNIERALATEGWMMESELVYLAEMALRSRSIAEVGSWMGRSTCALAVNCPGCVMAFDTWEGSAEHQPMLAEKPNSWLVSEFLRNTHGLPVVAVQGKSTVRAAEMAESKRRFDLIFLDASHDYDNVKADILAWTPLLTDGGILCGHDYDPPHWMGVKQAVDEFVPKFRIVPGTTIWTTEAV